MKALLAFRGLFARQASGLLLALLLSLITLAAGVALLGVSGWFITAAALTTAGLAFNLFAPSALVRGFSFIRILSRYGEKLIGHDATLRLLADLRGWLFARLFPRLPLADRTLRHGDLVSRLTADVDALDTAFLVAIGPISAALIIGAVMTAVFAALLPSAALVYGACLVVAVLVIPLGLVGASRRSGKDVVTRAADARMGVLDALSGQLDLTAYGVLGTVQADFGRRIRALSRARGRLATLTAIAGGLVQALTAGAVIGVLWVGLEAVSAGRLDGPVLVGLVLGTLASFEAVSAIVRSVGKLSTAIAAAERLTELAEAPVAAIDPSQPQAIPVAGGIALENVTFCYGRGAPVLQGLDLEIAAGERVAIIGPSGGGKSSLLKLLLRLATPQAGRVSLGGVAVDAVRLADLHAHIALLSQDSPLFNDTIRANLLIGRADASETQLWDVLEQAGIAEFVRTLPRTLDTLLGESGSTVSVGQARRLCLARALLSPAPVILLDEPTTGLDRATELAFFKTLATAMVGRTVLLVTHSAIPEGTVDRVLTLRNGRLE